MSRRKKLIDTNTPLGYTKFLPDKASVALSLSWHTFVSVALIIFSVFVLIGLIQAWLKEKTIAKKLGQESGIKAIVVSALFGSILVGPP